MTLRNVMIGPYSFSQIELRDLLKAWTAISLAFGIILNTGSITLSIIISALTVGIGFLSHEMAHKFIAQNYHLKAEFRSDNKMLILAIIMSFFGFVFAAPGAVYIMGYVSQRKNGIISFGGPATNLALSIIFLLLSFLKPTGILGLIIAYGFNINTWLALFNMIPFGNFDGIKIFRWNKVAYFSIVIIAILFIAL